MRTVLLTGSSGQLGTALRNRAEDFARIGLRLYPVTRADCDFDRPQTIATAFDAIKPDLVINAAAFTAVDLAETETEAARRANCDAPALLAACCARAGIPLMHVSTDYVFDGRKAAPYVETDPTCPTGAYGRSKRDGETAVLAACPQAIVLRTSWVYAANGKNFVRTMLGAARKNPHLRVVADQRGCPTSANDLAQVIFYIATQWRTEWRPDYAGIFHAAGQGDTTWHAFATAIFQCAARHGLTPPEITPIRTEDWPTPAQRPMDSRLDCAKLERVFGITLPRWEDSLARVVDQIFAQDASSQDRAVASNCGPTIRSTS